MDRTFVTRQTKHKSDFERSFNERFGNTDPSQSKVAVSPQLANKKQEMEEVTQQLEDTRAKFESWKTNFERKQKDLDEKQRALDEQKANLDKFSKHHLQELEKAKRREADEIENAKRLQSELEELTSVEKQLNDQNEGLKDELEELQPYADYLQSVVEQSRQFETIESILDRQHALVKTHAEYVDRYSDLLRRFGTEEQQLEFELELKRSQLVRLNMKASESRAKASQMKKLNQYNRTTLVKDIQRIEEKHTELTRVKSAIRAIYNRALSKSTGPLARAARSVKNPTEEMMLKFIETRFVDLYDILHDPHIRYIQKPFRD